MKAVGPGEAVRIMTGAQLPKAATVLLVTRIRILDGIRLKFSRTCIFTKTIAIRGSRVVFVIISIGM